MPFIKRKIDPVKLRQGALLDQADVSLGEEHEVIVNKSYTQILLQLSQLATFANEIFKDLSQECQGVINKSHKLKTRVWEIEQKSKQLNVLETDVPESTLEIVGEELAEPTCVQPRQDTGLFTAVTRPECVQRLYLKADLTPRAVYASLGPQGWKSAKRFCLTPVLKQPGETTYTINKRRKAPYKIAYERNEKLKPPRPRPRSAAPRPQSCAGLLDYSHQTGKSALPTPEEHALRSAKSQPSILVPIDTSITAFERFAESRASLRNLQSYRERCTHSANGLSRLDPRRQTISSTNDLRRRCSCQEETRMSTEKLLESNVPRRKSARRKNPDMYIEDNAELFATERSRSKEKRESVIKKLVRRSRSLPRNIGRERSHETLVPPDFYDINPQHTLIVAQNGAYINDKDEKIYTNFYGAPNTELPSPRRVEKMRKSKSDHQLNDRVRSKSSSAMEDMKLRLPNGKKRPRSVSAERSHSVLGDSEDRRYNSLSKTFTGLFGKGRKSKTLPNTASAHSRDSLNTVFTSHSEGEAVKRHSKQRTAHTTLSTQITLRKRDSKATTSSSGRWSGSERFSLDSDGLYSGTSQNRLSRASADRDSALGADINDNRTSLDGEKLSPPDETNSLYSVDQDGFYTTMHTDIRLAEETLPSTVDIDDDFGNLSLISSSSTCTSTHTLNEKTTPSSNHNSSLGSYPDSDQAEEISQRVASKVEAGRSINRYSLVMGSFDDDDNEDNEDEMVISDRTPKRRTSLHGKSSLKQSKTYESELDLVLEDLSESDTVTVQSDTESVHSLRLSRRDGPSTSRCDTKSKSLTDNSVCSNVTDSTQSMQVNDQLLRYKLLNGCTKYQKLPHTGMSTPTNSRQLAEEDNSRGCKSLPRNLRNGVSSSHLNGLISTLDNMGSWPRKLSRINTELGKESHLQSQTPTKPSTDSVNIRLNQQAAQHNKRRSLSPGKLKSTVSSNENTEKIHKLIEEARRMSSMSDKSPSSTLKRPVVGPPLSSTKPNSEIDLVSPYASSDVVTTPPNESSDYFRRQPSYKIACSNEVTPRKVLPRSNSGDTQVMRRNYSYRQANRLLRTQNSDSILENKILDTSDVTETSSLARAPSYKIAQSQSFDRSSRAPSYRKALETVTHENDSGLGSGDLTSSSSAMTSSSESNQSDTTNGRQSSYRTATENGSKTVEVPVPALHSRVIKDCMKGVYENEEIHLSKPLSISSKPELVRIDMKTDSKQHYAVPKIPAQPTSFHPTYVNIEIGFKAKQAYKKSLQPSKSAPQPTPDSPDCVSKLSLEQGKCMTPPARSVYRKARPSSSYIPNETDEVDAVPHNRLMLPKYNQSTFPSMEMLKREEMAVISVLGKIRRSTRPLSYVQTDI